MVKGHSRLLILLIFFFGLLFLLNILIRPRLQNEDINSRNAIYPGRVTYDPKHVEVTFDDDISYNGAVLLMSIYEYTLPKLGDESVYPLPFFVPLVTVKKDQYLSTALKKLKESGKVSAVNDFVSDANSPQVEITFNGGMTKSEVFSVINKVSGLTVIYYQRSSTALLEVPEGTAQAVVDKLQGIKGIKSVRQARGLSLP